MNRVRDMNGIFLWTVCMGLAGSLVSGLLQSLGPGRTLPFLFSQLMLALPLLVYILKYHIPAGELLRFKGIRPINVVLLVLFAFFITPFMNFLNAVSLLFTTNVIEDTAERIIYSQPLFISLFAIAFVPCILEEIVYRGAFFNEYRKVAPLRGIFLSAFLFGIMHLNLNQFFYAFAMGILFALLVESCDSILASMIVHFTINARSVLTVYLEPVVSRFLNETMGESFNGSAGYTQSHYSLSEQWNGILGSLGPMVFSTAIAAVIFVTIVKNAGRTGQLLGLVKGKEKGRKKREPLSSVWLWFGIGVCLFLMIGGEIW